MTPRLPSAVASDSKADSDAGASRAFRVAFRHRTFSVLFAAEVQSILGDQLARVALAVLVFERSGSVSATAAIYAATFVPSIVGGLFLSGLGDVLPRRVLLVLIDLVRAAAFAAMAVPGLSLGWIIALLTAAVLLGPVFTATAVGQLAAALSPEVFRTGTGLRMISSQAAQVAGFVVAGAVVAVIEPDGALLVNAATFVLSAMMIATLLPRGTGRGAGRSAGDAIGERRRISSAVAAVTRSRQARGLLLLAALTGLFIVPEGLSVPLGAELGVGPVATGVLFAAVPCGSVVGVLLVIKLVPPRRRIVAMKLMAMACGLPLAVTAAAPIVWVIVPCWFLAGVAAAFVVECMATLMAVTPAQYQSQLVGVSTAIIIGAQGVGIVAFGFVGELVTPSVAIGLAGAVGVVAAVVIVRTTRPRRDIVEAVASSPRHLAPARHRRNATVG